MSFMYSLLYLNKIMGKAVALLIKIYQLTLSPDHSWLQARYPGGYCKFSPSCSEYSKQVLLKRGLFPGIFFVTWRILSCNPWTQPKTNIF